MLLPIDRRGLGPVMFVINTSIVRKHHSKLFSVRNHTGRRLCLEMHRSSIEKQALTSNNMDDHQTQDNEEEIRSDFNIDHEELVDQRPCTTY